MGGFVLFLYTRYAFLRINSTMTHTVWDTKEPCLYVFVIVVSVCPFYCFASILVCFLYWKPSLSSLQLVDVLPSVLFISLPSRIAICADNAFLIITAVAATCSFLHGHYPRSARRTLETRCDD